MDQEKETRKKEINKLGDELLKRLKPEEKFLVTLHVVEDGKLSHTFLTNDFPNGDLMPSIGYLETEFMKILKRGTTGNGRM